MKQESNDVKQLAAQITSFVAKSSTNVIPMNARKALVPMLVMGTKEKNTLVKTNSELGLVNVLHLRHGDETYKVSWDWNPRSTDHYTKVASHCVSHELVNYHVQDCP